MSSLDYQPDTDLAAQIRAGIEAHVAERNARDADRLASVIAELSQIEADLRGEALS